MALSDKAALIKAALLYRALASLLGLRMFLLLNLSYQDLFLIGYFETGIMLYYISFCQGMQIGRRNKEVGRKRIREGGGIR
jgi:hypothetical protein